MFLLGLHGLDLAQQTTTAAKQETDGDVSAEGSRQARASRIDEHRFVPRKVLERRQFCVKLVRLPEQR